MSHATGTRSGAGSRMIAGSLNRLNRKGATAASESGPPRFISTIAVRAMSAGDNRLREQSGQHGDVLGRRLRQYPMTEIEHPRSTGKGLADVPHGAFEGGAAGH